MSNYPAAIAHEVCELFESAHPRGWALVCGSFGIRSETVVNFFRFDQRTWFYLKRLVKCCQKILPDKLPGAPSRSGLEWLLKNSSPWRDFWQHFRQFDRVHTDELDYLTNYKYAKPV